MIFNFIIRSSKERRIEMGSAKKLLVVVSVVVAVSFIAPSIATGQGLDESNWPVRTTFDRSVQVGSMVLDPGTYDFRLTSGTVARTVVAIYSVDQRRWIGMVIGVNDDTPKMSSFTLEDVGDNQPALLRYWFYPDWNRGIKFIYGSANTVDTIAEAMPAASR